MYAIKIISSSYIKLLVGIHFILFYIIFLQELFNNPIVFIFLSILISAVWYWLLACLIKLQKKSLIDFPLKISNYLGLFISIIHLMIVYNLYRPDLISHAQYQLSWMYLSIIDFPITSIFFLLQKLHIDVNTSGLIIFGIFGTIMWYILICCIMNGRKGGMQAA